ncbi:MAG: hypothetical protein K2X48_11425 [Chitinophagaceae bacterium]|nr:hypothetical protein [Chitinophagaceae bacterium]
MSEIIVRTKSKRQEKVVKNFSESLDIDYMTEAQEEEALYQAMKKGRKTKTLPPKEQEAFLRKLKLAK